VHCQKFYNHSEVYIYKYCSLSTPSFGDKPKEYNEESITLHSSVRVSESDLNLYDDNYMNEKVNMSYSLS
jgi:hypothetical protein